MASIPTQTRSWLFSNYPEGLPTYSSSNEKATFKLVVRDVPKLERDQVLVKTLYLSNDPAQRGWIEPSIPADRMFMPPVTLNTPMRVRGLGEVVESTAGNLPKGSLVLGTLGWNEYAVLNTAECTSLKPLPDSLSITHYLGAFGLSGMTAWYGLVVIGEVKQGMRLVVSGAAGATGSMVVQIAKKVSFTSLSIISRI